MKKLTYIITPTWNNSQYTIDCFKSVAENTENYEIVWIDNRSEEEERKKVCEFLDKSKIKHYKILLDENEGFVKGTNHGLKYAMKQNPEYVVFLNNDTEVYSGWLERMIAVTHRNVGAGIVGPLASPSHGWQEIDQLRLNKAKEFSNLPEYNQNPKEYAKKIALLYNEKDIEVYPNVAFFCTLISKKVINKIGYLSEDYGMGLGDDDDFCSRALDAGFKIYLAKDVFIFHNHRTTFKLKYSDDEIKSMKKQNAKVLIDKHSRYKNLIESNKPNSTKEFIKKIIKITFNDGFVPALHYYKWYSTEWKSEKDKSWFK